MFEFRIRMEEEVARVLADVLIAKTESVLLNEACAVLADRLRSEAEIAWVEDVAWLANELWHEGVSKETSIMLAEEHGHKVWDDVMATAWAFERNCLADDGEYLSTRLKMRLRTLGAGRHDQNWEDIVLTAHDLAVR